MEFLDEAVVAVVAVVWRDNTCVTSSKATLYRGMCMVPRGFLFMRGVDTERFDDVGVALFFPEWRVLRLSGGGRSGALRNQQM